MSYLRFLQYNAEDLLRQAGQHATLVLSSIVLALVVGLLLGVASARRRSVAAVALPVAAAALNIPSLALLSLLAVWFQFFDPKPAIIGLAIYAVLPILRNTYTGIRFLDPAVVEAALGMGMSRQQILWRIELPLATPLIVAGLRQATVMTVGIATVAAVIGAGGLGVSIMEGLGSYSREQIVSGALPVAVIGVATDSALALAERRLLGSRLGAGVRRGERMPQ